MERSSPGTAEFEPPPKRARADAPERSARKRERLRCLDSARLLQASCFDRSLIRVKTLSNPRVAVCAPLECAPLASGDAPDDDEDKTAGKDGRKAPAAGRDGRKAPAAGRDARSPGGTLAAEFGRARV